MTTSRSARVIAAVLICVGVAAGAWWTFGRSDRADPESVRVATASPTCSKDVRCIGAKSAEAAGVACRPGIEDLAGYGVRWTGATKSGPAFDRFRWHDEARGTITLGGDQAAFATASGAYRPVVYECDYDPTALAVLGVRVTPGPVP